MVASDKRIKYGVAVSASILDARLSPNMKENTRFPGFMPGWPLTDRSQS
jgi:hypothetical protein